MLIKIKYLKPLVPLFLFSCSHSIEVRTSHFLTPITSEKQWGGSVNLTVASPTVVTLVDDAGTNPPLRTGIKINDSNADPGSKTNALWIDLKLSVLPSFELMYTDHVFAAKWQVLNFGQKNNYVASLLGGYGTKKKESGNSSEKATTFLATARAGFSVGYLTEKYAPYFSFIYNKHAADTVVDNTFGSFGSYLEDGEHQHYSIGASTIGRGLNIGVEYNYTVASWNNISGNHGTFGVQLGAEW